MFISSLFQKPSRSAYIILITEFADKNVDFIITTTVIVTQNKIPYTRPMKGWRNHLYRTDS